MFQLFTQISIHALSSILWQHILRWSVSSLESKAYRQGRAPSSLDTIVQRFCHIRRLGKFRLKFFKFYK